MTQGTQLEKEIFPSFLCIIVDCDGLCTFGNADIESIIRNIAIYANTFVTMHRKNHICVIGNSLYQSQVIFPSVDQGGEFIPLSSQPFMDIVARGLLELVLNIQLTFNAESNSNIPDQFLSMKCSAIKSFTRALCMVNGQLRAFPRIQPRVFMIQRLEDDSNGYNTMMNCVFGAQKLNTVIDSLMLSPSKGLSHYDSPILQQASLLTGGIYQHFDLSATSMNMTNIPGTPISSAGLLLLLFDKYLCSTATRRKFNSVAGLQESVSFQAACVCHGITRDFCYVCTVCLSLLCGETLRATVPPQCVVCKAKNGV